MVAAERRDPSKRRVFIMCGFTKHMIMPSVYCGMGASPQVDGNRSSQGVGDLIWRRLLLGQEIFGSVLVRVGVL